MHGGGFYHPQKYMVAPKTLPEQPALVLLGELLHLADRLRAVHGAVPLQRQHLPDRQERVRLVARRGASPRRSASSSLFWVVYDVICRVFGQRKDGDRIVGVLVFALHRLRLVAGLPAVRRARGLPAGRRDDRHDDERQRVLLDHPGPAQGDRADAAGAAGRPDPRPARQAAQRAQHLLHAAGADRDAQQPLRLALRRAAQLAGAGADDAGRRADPPLLRAAPQGAGGRASGCPGSYAHRRGADRRAGRGGCAPAPVPQRQPAAAPPTLRAGAAGGRRSAA